MSFLNILYLAGLSALSLPIIFHMIRRTPKGRVPFSTTMFLEPSPPKITKRSRLDNWPLLLLRALALILLVAAFARPFLREIMDTESETALGSQHVILLDTSASMRRMNGDSSLFSLGVEKAKSILDDAEDADQIAVLAFDRSANQIVSFDEWKELEGDTRAEVTAGRIDELQPGWAYSDLGSALVQAAEQLDSLNSGEAKASFAKTITVISDMQAGSKLEALQSFEWPDGVGVQLETIKADKPTNAGVQVLADASIDETPETFLRVSNSADSDQEQFEIVWIDDNGTRHGDARSVYVAPGKSRTVRVPTAPKEFIANRLTLLGDDHEFDNIVHLNETGAEHILVHYYGGDDVNDPESLRFYIDRAFPQTRYRRVQVIGPDSQGNMEPLTNTVRLVVATDGIEANQIKSLKDYLKSGGTMLFVSSAPGEQTSLARLLEVDHLEIAEAEVEDYAMVTDVDFAHPMFAAFDDVRFADFTRIHVWKHRKIKIDGLKDYSVLAKFDDGDPAIVEKRIDKGRIIWFASGWNPLDSQLALSSKFVPLLNSMLDIGSVRFDTSARHVVGDNISLAAFQTEATDSATVVTPDETEVKLTSLENSFRQTTLPGTYTIASAAGAPRFTVNLSASESKTELMPVSQLEAVGVKLATDTVQPTEEEAAETQRQLQAQELESRQKFWRWLILATLVVLLLETWLAGSMAKKAQAANG